MLKLKLFLVVLFFSSSFAHGQISIFDPENTKEFVFIKLDSTGQNILSYLCLKTNFTDSTLDSIQAVIKDEGYKETSKTISQIQKINKSRGKEDKYLVFGFNIMEEGDNFQFQGSVIEDNFSDPKSYVGYGDKKKFNFPHKVKGYIINHLENHKD